MSLLQTVLLTLGTGTGIAGEVAGLLAVITILASLKNSAMMPSEVALITV